MVLEKLVWSDWGIFSDTFKKDSIEGNEMYE